MDWLTKKEADKVSVGDVMRVTHKGVVCTKTVTHVVADADGVAVGYATTKPVPLRTAATTGPNRHQRRAMKSTKVMKARAQELRDRLKQRKPNEQEAASAS